MPDIITHRAPFIFLWGARGTGKTYGAIKYLLENHIYHMYMRRTQTQLEIINKREFSPYKPVCEDMGITFDCESITKANYGVYGTIVNDEGIEEIDHNNKFAVTCALSTVSNLRGFNANDIGIWVYDEFIPEKQERPIKNEAHAFLNAYETINRNRELQGRPPLKVICMANSNNIACPLFMELELVERALKLEESKDIYYYDEKRDMLLVSIGNSPISQAKSATALYKLVGDKSSFRKMALYNSFNLAQRADVRHPQLKQLDPVVAIGEIGIWFYKNPTKYLCHVAFAKDKSVPYYEITDYNKKMVKNLYSTVWSQYLYGHISFENYMCEILLQKIFM